MIIGITGGTGFIGHAVQTAAEERGDKLFLFSRKAGTGRRKFSLTESLDVSGCDGLVHLAGESILGLWTPAKRRSILESRIEGTRRLVEGIAAAASRQQAPRVLVSASAIGFYGDTGDRVADEDSPGGEGFLAEVTQAWETEARKAESYGVRVVCLRIGFVLGRDSGAMQLMAPVFRAGLGGQIGSGYQWMSLIEVGDLASMVLEALHNDSLQGPMNAVMPEPVTNADFTRALGRVLHRPVIFPVPAFALRIVLGDLSNLLLCSQRIVPKKFQEAGFSYQCPSLAPLMEKCLGSVRK